MLKGVLGDRDAWSAVGRCSIEKAVEVVGTRTAMLVMREAYYGTTRFDDFAERVGMTRAATSTRLSALVEAGLLEQRDYREDGQRTRKEYVLTDAGRDLVPVVWALFQWGRKHLPSETVLELAHHDCGAPVDVEVRCADGHEVGLDDVELRLPR
ncbi:helix-turn-helix transcriptional regulator [Mumia zhuanghuii]|uniref:Helix-turn-helix transcriptional regulator n=1 Tax=Mumia zhuanghuii TaxID=2585211 RepID=A0A5C4MDJ0_9ACTN|nr:helix-turn-helix transcriptional regulator [Mumia zhuanghuii]TNC51800.1 helix-turn-helix transcriptional regulator [Mumia zhuanghuii]